MERLTVKRLGIKRLECLDGLRGLLAFYVLLGHMAPFAVLPSWVQDILSHGGAAVDVFFMLSGLVITQSLLRTNGRAKPFLIARAARIFPVFLPIFALAIVVEPLSCGFDRMPWIGPDGAARSICSAGWPPTWPLEIIAHLTMTHGLFPNGVLKDVWISFLGSAWSLSTEWQFYFFALLAAGVGRRFWPLRGSPAAKHYHGGPEIVRAPAVPRVRRRAVPQPAIVRCGTTSPVNGLMPGSIIDPGMLCWMLLGLAVAGVAWRLAVPEAWQFSRAFLPNKAHFFALGVASLAVVRQQNGAFRDYGLVLGACLTICATQESIGKMLPPLAWTFCLMAQLGLMVKPVPERSHHWLAGLGQAGQLLRSRPAQYLGSISYSLYLVNEPIHKVVAALLSYVANADAMVFTVLWIPSSIGLPVAAAIWLRRHVEGPGLRWGREVAGKSAADRGAPSVQAHSRRV